MNKKVYLFVMTTLLLVLTACQGQEIKIVGSIASEENKITAEEFNDQLHSEYGLQNLEKHEIYFKDGLVQAEFYFNKSLEQWQEDSVYLFAMNAFIYKKYSAIAVGHVYDAFVQNSVEGREISGLSILTYLDGKLAGYQMYLPEGQQAIHLKTN